MTRPLSIEDLGPPEEPFWAPAHDPPKSAPERPFWALRMVVFDTEKVGANSPEQVYAQGHFGAFGKNANF